MSARKEGLVEMEFVAIAESYGALVRKITYQGRNSAPDRWAFFPGGKVLCFEAKYEGEVPTKAQIREMKKLRRKGLFVAWTDQPKLVRELVEDIFDMFPADYNLKWEL